MHSLLDLLVRAAALAPDTELHYYDINGSTKLTYSQLLSRAEENAVLIKQRLRVATGQVVLLHLDSQLTYTVWFWSLISAGVIPVVSTPLPADGSSRERHLRHLRQLLHEPLVLTTDSLKSELDALGNLDLISIDSLTPLPAQRANSPLGQSSDRCSPVAFMMLTSGSTGNAKSVEITHAQVLASAEGKSRILGTTQGKETFLNWIGFDHVACVTEIHLHAMAVCATQVHLEPTMTIRDPLLWLAQLSAHSVSITFAPNFFLAAVIKAVGDPMDHADYDLSNLRVVVSGGEANSVTTGLAFNEIVKKLGAMTDVLCPAFGMTESCAGSVYNLGFPALELDAELDFCSVGQSIHTMNIRIVDPEGRAVPFGHMGSFEISGPAVFRAYHSDTAHTTQSFDGDGWFKTGDTGYLDQKGNLILAGRTKDSIIINGNKYFSHELEASVEDAAAPYLVSSYTSAFPTWPRGSDSEEIIITFRPSEHLSDDASLVTALDRIAGATLLYCSKKPRSIIPLPEKFLSKSSLGKLSRSALKKAYEAGEFDAFIEEATKRAFSFRRLTRSSPGSALEKQVAEIFAAEFGLNLEEVGVDDSLTDFGVDSIRLLRFKGALEQRLGRQEEIPIGTLLANPSVRSLARALSGVDHVGAYDPVVELQSRQSQETPIWFIHPGLGEILVFLNISRYFSDRQVYAIRAPGFNPGEKKFMFTSIDEMTDVYMEAIRRTQPNGPYILIGYSFGSMIAFETTKKLEAAGEQVFMGSLNGPPHIKWRMVQIDWCELFLNLAYFLGFLTEKEASEKSGEYRKAGYTKHEIVKRILAIAPPELLETLSLNEEKLIQWADISHSLQGLARTYDPSGTVEHIDVFYANPLLAVGSDKQTWLEQHLHPWSEFSRQPVRFHDSPGAHYTMLSPENVFRMQKVLRSALRARGA